MVAFGPNFHVILEGERYSLMSHINMFIWILPSMIVSKFEQLGV